MRISQIPPPPEKPLPRVRLTINGRPRVLTSSIPKIVLTPAAISRALGRDGLPPAETFNVQTASSAAAGPEHLEDDEDSDSGTFLGDRAAAQAAADGPSLWEDDDDEWDGVATADRDDMRREFESVTRDLPDEPDTEENAAGAPSADSGPRSSNPTYCFCPAPFRASVLHVFAAHASQHSLLPERHGQSRSAEEIYRDAVSEMYHHCKANNLCEVWAYLWTAWYQRSRWKLWARSAYSASIPRKRTTMIVEALWRNLKRMVLYMYNRPPLDLAVYAIVTQALPPYRLTLNQILVNPRKARAASVSHTQQALHRAWKRLAKAPIRGEYNTNIARWTCDCGSQKYHAHLLCKHLVQASGTIPASWWPKATRYHIPPFYTVPINGVIARAPEKMRDQAWLPRMAAHPAIIATHRMRTPSPGTRMSDSDVDIPGLDGMRSSSPVSPSLHGLYPASYAI